MKVILAIITIVSISSALSYTESSNGLETPIWELGKTGLKLGDINKDGFVDIVSLGDHGNPLIAGATESGILIWFGDGAGNWSSYMLGYFGYGGCALGDVNNDGNIDLAYGIHHNYSGNDLGNEYLEVALGDGTGLNWTPYDDGLSSPGFTKGLFDCDFADINNDGLLDLGTISFDCIDGGVYTFLNQGNGYWQHTYGIPNSTVNVGTSDFVFGDINRDGNVDFAATCELGTIYIGDGTGNWVMNNVGLPPSYPWGYYGISLGDVDNDGWLELSRVNDQGGVEIWKYNQSLNRWVNASYNLPPNGAYIHTQLIDVDIDGFIDLCALGDQVVSIFKNYGNGTYWFEVATVQIPQGLPRNFRVGDFDHNGYPDIVVVNTDNYPNGINHIHAYKETTIPESLFIKPVFPRGRERFFAGSVHFIDWVCAIPPGYELGSVKLELSVNGPSGPWEIIAQNLINNGRHQWHIPENTTPSTNCYIRYTLTTTQDTATCLTPFAFEIMAAPGIVERGNKAIEKLGARRPALFRNNLLGIEVYDIMGKMVSNPSAAGIYFIKGKDDREPIKIILLK